MRVLAAVSLLAMGCGGLAGTQSALDAGPAGSPDARLEDTGASDGRVTDTRLVDEHTAETSVEAASPCPSDGGSSEAAVVAVASSPNIPAALAAGATGIYWSTAAGAVPRKGSPIPDGTIEGASLDGCSVRTLATGQIPTAIAVGSSDVFWTTTGPPPGGGAGAVLSVPVGGGAVTTLAQGQTNPMAITVESTDVYWANAGDYGGSTGSIVKVPLAGGAPTTLSDKRGVPRSIAVDAANVYWTDYGQHGWHNGAVLQMAKGGGAVVTLVSKLEDPSEIGIDSANVYFPDDSGVESVPIGGGTRVTAIPGSVWGFALDATGLYWFDGSGNILTRPLGGWTPTTLAAMQDATGSLAVGATNVYWTTFSSASGLGSVLRTAK